MKKLLAVAVTALSLVTLSGCSTTHTASDMYSSLKSECGEFTGGKGVDTVKVTQKADTKIPAVSFATGIDSTKIETKVITEGKGPKITGNQFIRFEFLQAEGATGKVSGSTKFDGTDTQSQFLDAETNLCKALAGVTEGSRIALLVPSEIMSGDATTKSAGVLIFDIKQVFLPRAVGDSKSSQNGMPTIIRATNGQPTIQFAKGEAPTELTVVPLIEGWGEPVAANRGQKVTVHYSGWIWENQNKFDSSWDSGRPAEFSLEDGALIEGFVKGLDGQKVGSQVLVVIPPALAYGDQDQENIPANSTLIFVVDILGVTK